MPRFAGHRQFVSVKDADGRVLVERMAEGDGWSLDIARDGGITFRAHEDRSKVSESTLGTFGAFLRLGVEHTLTGYDHLLFLVALLVVSPGLLVVDQDHHGLHPHALHHARARDI